MEPQTHGGQKYPTSALLRSSAGRGWATIPAELRWHGVSETPVIVPQHIELCLAVAGNGHGLVTRTGGGQCQQAVPRNGAIWLSPIGIGDNEIAIAAPIPEAMHLYLWAALFRRLSEDFRLAEAPARSIRLEKAMADIVAGKLPLARTAANARFSSQASFSRSFRRATGVTRAEYRRQRRNTPARARS